MGEIVRPIDPENYRRVAERIKRLWNEGTVEWDGHAVRQMKRRGIDEFDIERVIRTGRITDHSKPRDNWRFVMDGNGLDERSIRVILEINGLLLVISAIERK
jgi:hypothetical protein